MRTYRVTVRGRFRDVPEPARSRLRAAAGEHGVELRGVVFRLETCLTEGVAEPRQQVEAEGRRGLEAWAERHAVAVTVDHINATCMDDIKVRRRGTGSRRAG